MTFAQALAFPPCAATNPFQTGDLKRTVQPMATEPICCDIFFRLKKGSDVSRPNPATCRNKFSRLGSSGIGVQL